MAGIVQIHERLPSSVSSSLRSCPGYCYSPSFTHQWGLREAEQHTQGHRVGNVGSTAPAQDGHPDWVFSPRTWRGAVQLFVFDFLPVCLAQDFMILPHTPTFFPSHLSSTNPADLKLSWGGRSPSLLVAVLPMGPKHPSQQQKETPATAQNPPPAFSAHGNGSAEHTAESLQL